MYAQEVDRTLTIGDVTVTLHRVHHTNDGVEVHHSFSTSHPSGDIHSTLGGYSVGRTDGTVVELKRASKEQPEIGESYWYALDTPLAEEGERLDISLGTYVIPGPDVVGTAKIEFEPDFGKSYDAALDMPGATKPLEMQIGADL